jgi:hypothetical protein
VLDEQNDTYYIEDPTKLPEQFAPLLRPRQLFTRCQLQIAFDPDSYYQDDSVFYDLESYVPLLEQEMGLLGTSLRIIKPMVDTFKTLCPQGDVQVSSTCTPWLFPTSRSRRLMVGRRKVQNVGLSKLQSVHEADEDMEFEDAEHGDKVAEVREAAEEK